MINTILKPRTKRCEECNTRLFPYENRGLCTSCELTQKRNKEKEQTIKN